MGKQYNMSHAPLGLKDLFLALCTFDRNVKAIMNRWKYRDEYFEYMKGYKRLPFSKDRR